MRALYRYHISGKKILLTTIFNAKCASLHFIKQEEENFALFSYVNELNDELESLQARMEQLTAAIDEARAQNVHRDQQQTETLDKITLELEEQTALANVAEEDLAQVNE